MDFKLELVPIPVADVDRAKTFYTERAGFSYAGFRDPDGNGWTLQQIGPAVG